MKGKYLNVHEYTNKSLNFRIPRIHEHNLSKNRPNNNEKLK